MAVLIESSEPTDTVSARSLSEILGCDLLDEPVPSEAVISVCAGEWRRNADGSYTLWLDPSWDDSE